MKACSLLGVFASALACALWAVPAAGTAYLGLYADENHSITKIDGTPIYSAEVWIWCLPDARGVMAAEFGLTYTANVIPSVVTWNAYSARFGDLPGSVNFAFNECKTGWTWIAHQTIYVVNGEYGEARLAPFSEAIPMQIATCEPGYPLYEAAALSNILSINCGSVSESLKPRLSAVEAIAADTIMAAFDNHLMLEACWWVEPHHFRVISATSPPETLSITDVGYRDLWLETVWVRLAQNLMPGIDYVLEAYNMCNDDGVGSCCCCICQCMNCADSEMGFSYTPIATLLGGFSAEPLAAGIRVSWTLGSNENEIAFAPMRLARGGAAFEPVAADVIEESPLRYRFVDSDARPGTAYKYCVDYTMDGGRHTLFETDWIEALPARFALHQNLPNPFNPSTRIDFELGEPASATLAIYDIAGRLVRTLVDGELPAGAHSALWEGRSERGEEAASGIYFYRLRAGSFTETRKMVLLR